jgi:hypothetical protein
MIMSVRHAERKINRSSAVKTNEHGQRILRRTFCFDRILYALPNVFSRRDISTYECGIGIAAMIDGAV